MNGDIVDLAAFRAAKIELTSAVESTAAAEKRQCRVSLSIVDDRVVFDHEALDHVISWDADQAIEFGNQVTNLGALLRAHLRARDPEVQKQRELERQKREKRRIVPIVGKSGRRLPPLKVRGWALETLGGHTGADAPHVWVRMTSSRRSEMDARRLVAEYVAMGYAPDKVRVVAVDHRGRVIPPERMPAS